MRRVSINRRVVLAEDTFPKFRLNSPPGGWFPALQELSWRITESNLPYADLFISPHLERVSISMLPSWRDPEVPHDVLQAAALTISTLPGSALRRLDVDISLPWTYFKDPLSSLVLRCGSSLTEFTSPIPLSDEAVNHLIQLPHLLTWHTKYPPPSYSTLSLPPVFPPLTEFTLGGGAVSGWFSLFERLEHSVSATQGVTPLSQVKESLKCLNVDHHPGPIINVTLTSTIQMFRNLVRLNVETQCYDINDAGQCVFNLNDEDVTKLAMALPRLECLVLGRPCSENTCVTTVGCLLQISVHCVKLQELQVHFNTANLVGDLKKISKDPKLQELLSCPRCTLSRLDVYQIPLILDAPGLETVVSGMIDIFPHLERCNGLDEMWGDVSEGIMEFSMVRTPCSLGFLLHLTYP